MNSQDEKHSKVKIEYEGNEVHQTEVGELFEAVGSIPRIVELLRRLSDLNSRDNESKLRVQVRRAAGLVSR